MMYPTHIWCVVDAVDMRRGIEGLSQHIQMLLDKSPCDGSAYLFCNRNKTRLKMLVWDGTGVWLCQRRLHKGAFVWPRAEMPTLCITTEQWQWLITGVDWRRLCAQPSSDWRV